MTNDLVEMIEVALADREHADQLVMPGMRRIKIEEIAGRAESLRSHSALRAVECQFPVVNETLGEVRAVFFPVK